MTQSKPPTALHSTSAAINPAYSLDDATPNVLHQLVWGKRSGLIHPPFLLSPHSLNESNDVDQPHSQSQSQPHDNPDVDQEPEQEPYPDPQTTYQTYRTSVIETVYKADCTLDITDKWNLAQHALIDREHRRKLNLLKKIEEGKVKCNEIKRKKRGIRGVKFERDAEVLRNNRSEEEKKMEEIEQFHDCNLTKPMIQASEQILKMRAVYKHIELKKTLPKDVRRATAKVDAVCDLRVGSGSGSGVDNVNNYDDENGSNDDGGGGNGNDGDEHEKVEEELAMNIVNAIPAPIPIPVTPTSAKAKAKPNTKAKSKFNKVHNALTLLNELKSKRLNSAFALPAQQDQEQQHQVDANANDSDNVTNDNEIESKVKSKMKTKTRSKRLTLNLKPIQHTTYTNNDSDIVTATQQTPRANYIRNKAAVKIQSFVRGISARKYVDYAEFRLFPLRDRRSGAGRNARSRGVWLERRRWLLRRRIEVLDGCAGNGEDGNDVSVLNSSVAAEQINTNTNMKINEQLNAEAKMLHKNLRYIAACMLQHFMRTRLLKSNPSRLSLSLASLKKDRTEHRNLAEHSLTLNVSRKGYAERKMYIERRRMTIFSSAPLIIRMQKTWREYMRLSRDVQNMTNAIKLLKRIRLDRRIGEDFFKGIREDCKFKIGIAVDYNLMKRVKYVRLSMQCWIQFAHDMKISKARLLHNVQMHRSVVLCAWFRSVIRYKRTLIERVRPVLFTPLLSEYMRFVKSGDWEGFLVGVSELLESHDHDIYAADTNDDDDTTQRVIGLELTTSNHKLNKTLTHHITRSKLLLRMKVSVIPYDETSLPISFFYFIHGLSGHFFKMCKIITALNEAKTEEEEKHMIKGYVYNILTRHNLNSRSLSKSFRMPSHSYIKWYNHTDLCTNFKCYGILPMNSRRCTVCNGMGLPAFMRDTEAFVHGAMDIGNVDIARTLRFSDSNSNRKVSRGGNGGGRKTIKVKGIPDVTDPLNLLLIHCKLSIMAPVGGWRRKGEVKVEDVWIAAVRSCMHVIERLKRGRIVSVADLYGIENGGVDRMGVLDDYIEGEDDNALVMKVRKILKMLASCLKEEILNYLNENDEDKEEKELPSWSSLSSSSMFPTFRTSGSGSSIYGFEGSFSKSCSMRGSLYSNSNMNSKINLNRPNTTAGTGKTRKTKKRENLYVSGGVATNVGRSKGNGAERKANYKQVLRPMTR